MNFKLAELARFMVMFYLMLEGFEYVFAFKLFQFFICLDSNFPVTKIILKLVMETIKLAWENHKKRKKLIKFYFWISSFPSFTFTSTNFKLFFEFCKLIFEFQLQNLFFLFVRNLWVEGEERGKNFSNIKRCEYTNIKFLNYQKYTSICSKNELRPNMSSYFMTLQ